MKHKLTGPLEGFENLRVGVIDNETATHKPLLALMMLTRLKNEGTTSLRYNEIEPVLNQLLELFTPKRTSAIYPFWHLKNDKVWVIDSIPDASIRDERRPPNRTILRKISPLGRFSDDILKYLANNPSGIDKTADYLLEEYFPERETQVMVRRAIGLPELRVDVTNELVLGAENHLTFKRDVLYAYESKCAVCEKSTRLINVLIDLKVTAIRGFENGGEIHVNNGLAMCNVHNTLFTYGVITIEHDKGKYKLRSVDPKICNIYESGKIRKKRIVLPDEIILPKDKDNWPAPEFLNWHQEHIFAEKLCASS